MVDPWLSIITIVKDDVGGLRRTVCSIENQVLDGVQVLVIDGSTNLADAQGVLAEHGSVEAGYRWTPPEGIYAAMNSGLAEATGDYVYFLNAGDEFFDSGAVAAVRDMVQTSRAEWIYGQVCFVDEAGVETTPPPFDYSAEKAAAFNRGRFPPHQGTIARREALLSVGGFDTTYRIAADYASMLRLSLLEDPLEIPTVIARFHQGGISSTAWRSAIGEFHRARLEILHPRGLAALHERIGTAYQLTRARLFRGLVAPLRRARHGQ
jgi:glycosyltransferase involved in cell wall biosynthesis